MKEVLFVGVKHWCAALQSAMKIDKRTASDTDLLGIKLHLHDHNCLQLIAEALAYPHSGPFSVQEGAYARNFLTVFTSGSLARAVVAEFLAVVCLYRGFWLFLMSLLDALLQLHSPTSKSKSCLLVCNKEMDNSRIWLDEKDCE